MKKERGVLFICFPMRTSFQLDYKLILFFSEISFVRQSIMITENTKLCDFTD